MVNARVEFNCSSFFFPSSPLHLSIMSDKLTGYRVEYASSNRSKCKGPKPCSGTVITKGTLRFGTLVEIHGIQSFQWKHWGCVTPKVLEKIRGQFSDATELDGFDELTETDKSKIVKAYEEGHVADEDIPDSARKLEGEEQPKQKAAGKKKASKKDEDAAEGDGEQAEEKPKKKVSKKKDEDNLDGEDEVVKEKPKKARNTKKKPEAEAGEGDEKPKKVARPRSKKAAEENTEEKTNATAKKAAPKKRAPKKKTEKDEESGEDFSKGLAEVSDEADESEAEEEKPKKKAPVKNAAAKKMPVSKKALKADEDVDMQDEIREDMTKENAEETTGKKRKRALTSKSTTKPASKKVKTATKAKKTKEPADEVIEEEAE